MKKTPFVSSVIVLALHANFVFANDACLLETNATMMGVKLDIKDCLQNAGLPENQFKAQCEGISQAAVSMGGPAAKITYLTNCPTQFQAKCDSSSTAKTLFFYYKRSSDEAEGLKSSCELMGGVYTKGAF
tara:strand:+ start:2407 stop:2796 length:390 start_codon:yes stop_codon:yes gene_type:complete